MVLVSGYFWGFLAWDLLAVLECFWGVGGVGGVGGNGWDRELVGFVLGCLLAGISLLLSLYFFITSLFETIKLIKNIFSNNKISSVTKPNKI